MSARSTCPSSLLCCTDLIRSNFKLFFVVASFWKLFPLEVRLEIAVSDDVAYMMKIRHRDACSTINDDILKTISTHASQWLIPLLTTGSLSVLLMNANLGKYGLKVCFMKKNNNYVKHSFLNTDHAKRILHKFLLTNSDRL